MIQPVAISSYCVLVAPFVVVTIMLHRRYKRIEAEVIGLDSIVSGDPKTLPDPEGPALGGTSELHIVATQSGDVMEMVIVSEEEGKGKGKRERMEQNVEST